MSPLDIQAEPAARTMPDDIAARLRAGGKVFDENTMKVAREIYLPMLAQANWDGIRVTSDISYGPDPERHLLDVHEPVDGTGTGLPSVIFYHGGAMIRGHKNAEGGLIYGNVANFFASHGIVGVNATYRLAPNVQWPEGGRDVGSTVAWAREHIADFGGDPEKVFIMGHSAGASHAATYAFRTQLHPADGPGIAGAILMSGVYGIEPDSPAPNRVMYYGEDKSKYADMQLLGNVERADFPVLVSVAEFDPINFDRVAFALMEELVTKHKNSPRFKQVLGHTHISECNAIGTGDTAIGPDLIDFVRGIAG